MRALGLLRSGVDSGRKQGVAAFVECHLPDHGAGLSRMTVTVPLAPLVTYAVQTAWSMATQVG
jgi:hypothetical protein